MYYSGCRGKEGLRNLTKNSFKVKTGADGKEFIDITFNEKSKKNQGDSMLTSLNALHNDHHIITEIPDSDLCPVQSYKRYISVLNPCINDFFQHPNKSKNWLHKRGSWKEYPQKHDEGYIRKSTIKSHLHKSPN